MGWNDAGAEAFGPFRGEAIVRARPTLRGSPIGKRPSLRDVKYSSLTDQLMGLGTGRWALHHRAVQRARDGADIVFLSIGEPRIQTPEAIVETAIDSLRAGRTKYAIGRGEPELLGVLSERYSKRSGRSIGTDQVTFFPGSHTALYALCQTLLEAGDHIMVPEPFYAAYEGIIRASRAEIDFVPLRPDTHRTEALLR